jgi:protein-S-isoprenylcysteine O-methyltransferase Ste14
MTSRNPHRRLLVLYPRAWRHRYGGEIIRLTEELIARGETSPGRAALDLLAGAAAAWRLALARTVRVTGRIVGGGAVLALIVIATVRVAPTAARLLDRWPGSALFDGVELGWLMMEAALLVNGGRPRRRPTGLPARRRERRYRYALLACVVALTVATNIAPVTVGVAAIRGGAPLLATGIALMLTGIGLRAWSFGVVNDAIRAGNPATTAGPYRLLRHPPLTGMLLICLGIGLAVGNWVVAALQMLLPLAIVLWRVHIDETTPSLAGHGDRVRSSRPARRRLVPLIW